MERVCFFACSSVFLTFLFERLSHHCERTRAMVLDIGASGAERVADFAVVHLSEVG